MIEVYLNDETASEDDEERRLVSYVFEALPRAGDVVRLKRRNESKSYEVVRLVHVIMDKAQPPFVYIMVRPGSSPPLY